MKRRTLLVSLAVSALAPLPAFAQAPARVRRIGLLSLVAKKSFADAGALSLLVQGLREHGYTEGRDYVFEGRYADGDAAREHSRRVRPTTCGVSSFTSVSFGIRPVSVGGQGFWRYGV